MMMNLMSCTIIMNREIPSFSLDIQVLKQQPGRLAIKQCGTYLRYVSYILAHTCMNIMNHRRCSNTQYVKPVKIVVFRTIHPRLILGLPQQWYGHIVLKR